MSTRVHLALARFRWSMALLLFGWGLYLFDGASWKWMVTTLAVFSLPLVCQLTRIPWLRVASIWAVLVVAIQCTFPLFSGPTLLKGSPNISYEIDADHSIDLVGIRGKHRHWTDAEGYRVTAPVDYAKKAGLRIFTIGASTTACDYLDNGKTWPGLLEKQLRKKLPNRPLEVINTGVDGTSVLNHYAMLRDILRHRPDLVIFLLGVNDWNHQIKHALGYGALDEREIIKLKYSPLSQLIGRVVLRFKGAAPTPAKTVDNIRDPEEMRRRGTRGDPYESLRGSLKRVPKYEFRPERVSRDFSRTLDKIAALCRDSGIACVFLTNPTAYSPTASEELQQSFWMTPFFEKYTVSLESMDHLQKLYNRFIVDFGTRSALPVLDVAAKLEPSFVNFYDDVHFNEAGAAHVADALTAFLLERPSLLAGSGRVVGSVP